MKRTRIVCASLALCALSVSVTAASAAVSGTYKPKAWCGWYMRQQLGGGEHLNIARNWCRWGSASEPRVGAVVVKRNHVGMIVGKSSHGWLVKAGNDGGGVRIRVWNLIGTCIRGRS
jgi:hypothetical protein